AADDVGAGARIGERVGVLRHHAADERADGLRLAVAHGGFLHEANVIGHGTLQLIYRLHSPDGQTSGGLNLRLTYRLIARMKRMQGAILPARNALAARSPRLPCESARFTFARKPLLLKCFPAT